MIKDTYIDKIEIILCDYCKIQARERINIVENGVVTLTSFNRLSYYPSDDISKSDDSVKAIAKSLWTDDVKNKYNEYLESE